MTQHPRQADLTADAFVEWAMAQPSGRFELLRGKVIAMTPERVGHARVKADVLVALRSAIAAAGLPCEAFGDGMAVRIDNGTVYEPDASIRCGPRLANDVVLLDDPVVVAEVVSPSSRGIDPGSKLADYFRLVSVRHYLVVKPETRRVTHHERAAGGQIVARDVGEDASLVLEPPGVRVRVWDLFATL
jgi:Uma2 family endonuclease